MLRFLQPTIFALILWILPAIEANSYENNEWELRSALASAESQAQMKATWERIGQQYSEFSGNTVVGVLMAIVVLRWMGLNTSASSVLRFVADVLCEGCIADDLEELLPSRIKRYGPFKAKLWYANQIISAIISYAWAKVKRLSGVPAVMK